MKYLRPYGEEYNDALGYLRNQVESQRQRNVLYKEKSGLNQVKGYADPITAYFYDNHPRPNFIVSKRTNEFPLENPTEIELRCLAKRKTMGKISIDLSQRVHVETTTSNRGTGIKIYTSYDYDESLIPIVFIHGGAWIGGAMESVEDFLKHLAQNSKRKVMSLDYVLAPEKHGRWAVEECFNAIKWLASKLSRKKFVIAGDSAGGNIAAAISYLDRVSKTSYIHSQVLLYPVVTLDIEQTNELNSAFKTSEIRDVKVNSMIQTALNTEVVREKLNIVKQVYVNTESVLDSEFSPMMVDEKIGKKMPKTMIVTGQFDVLSAQDAAYANKLADFGVDVMHLQYLGQRHAFVEKYGFIPQAEDVMWEIKEWLEHDS